MTRVTSEEIHSLFSEIHSRYDLLNRLISFGLDRAWRNAVLQALPERRGAILDCCAGTGQLTRLMASHGYSVVGLDYCRPMLEVAARKKQEGSDFFLVEGDAQELPFPDRSFQAVTCAFSLRNLPDREIFFRETHRVLRPGGHAVFLELTRPENWLRLPHKTYVSYFLPWIGKLFSKSGRAYQYLADSIFQFSTVREIQSLMLSSGFQSAQVRSLSGGIVTLWDGAKDKAGF